MCVVLPVAFFCIGYLLFPVCFAQEVEFERAEKRARKENRRDNNLRQVLAREGSMLVDDIVVPMTGKKAPPAPGQLPRADVVGVGNLGCFAAELPTATVVRVGGLPMAEK